MRTRAQNANTTAQTPLSDLEDALRALPPGERVLCPNTKTEILKTRENLTRRRAEIPGADSHLEYIEALLIAEAGGKLRFKE